jgi:hypothetical protein
MKAAVRLYPVDVAMLPWSPHGALGVLERVLTRDEATGSCTRILRLPAGAAWEPGGEPAPWRELYVLSGEVAAEDRSFGAGSFMTRQGDPGLPAVRALRDTTLIEFQEAARPGGDKPVVTLDAAEAGALPWTRPDGSPPGLVHQVLSAGTSGSMTRVLRCAPFVATGVFVHDHAEEVLLLEGSYRMGDEFHATGTYTAKGPGVPHGPFLTHEGYVGLEVRNYL